MEDVTTTRAAHGRGSSIALLCFGVLVVCGCCVEGMKLDISSASEECFTETLTAERLETAKAQQEQLTLQAGFFLSSTRVVDGRVTSPTGSVVWARRHLPKESQVFEQLSNPTAGDYKLCFRSRSQFRLQVDVEYFQITHEVQETEDAVTSPVGTVALRKEEVAQHVHLQEVHNGVVRLQELLRAVGGEARYMKKRIARHAKTMESTNNRTLYYTLGEMLVLLAVAILQVVVYRQMFHAAEVKRGW